jgi:hypothetical protein
MGAIVRGAIMGHFGCGRAWHTACTSVEQYAGNRPPIAGWTSPDIRECATQAEKGAICVVTGDPNDGTSEPPNGDAYASTTGSVYDPTDTHAGQPTADTVKEQASQATDRAQQQAKSQLATRKNEAAGSLTDVSQAVSQVGSQLRQNEHDTLAQYADMAAQQVDRFASYLREHNVNEVLDEVQGLARRQPALFLAGAFALGVLGARFLKSSSPESGRRYARGRSGATNRDWREGGTRAPWSNPGAPSGVYDPGMHGVDVREIP